VFYTGTIEDHPYWTSMENILEMTEPFSINKDILV
jgi:hypothetical protein